MFVLQRMFPAFSVCCDEMINRWEELVGKTGSCELDVLDEFLNLGGDVISRAAFGSNIEEGRSIFLLQKEQCELILASPFTLFFPSLRCILELVYMKYLLPRFNLYNTLYLKIFELPIFP